MAENQAKALIEDCAVLAKVDPILPETSRVSEQQVKFQRVSPADNFSLMLTEYRQVIRLNNQSNVIQNKQEIFMNRNFFADNKMKLAIVTFLILLFCAILYWIFAGSTPLSYLGIKTIGSFVQIILNILGSIK